MFRAPDPLEPELPSTPPRDPFSQSSLYSPSALSTTPAGPPPRSSLSHMSTTPAGAPPRDLYSSIAYGSDSGRSNQQSSRALYKPHGHALSTDDSMRDDVALPQYQSVAKHLELKPEDAYFFDVARSLAPRASAELESDAFVLQSEEILEGLFHNIKKSKQDRDEQYIDTSLVRVVRNLGDLWQTSLDPPVSCAGRVGPNDSSSPSSKAAFLASLTLSLHHPGSGQDRRGVSVPQQSLSSRSIPETLVHWLSEYHNPFPNDYQSILNQNPNPTAHPRFWDGIFNTLARGDVVKALELLKAADFQYAATALDDGNDTLGYNGFQLMNTEQVITRAVSVLESCPAMQSTNWDTTGTEWTMFRNMVHQAFEDLQTFAEGEGAHLDALAQSTHLGMSTLSQMSRKAQSQVPWSIYQNLEYFYGQLLGTQQEVAAASQDFLENVLCSAIWWDGSDDDEANATLATSRRSGRRPHTRLVDLHPRKAYTNFLARTFRRTTFSDENSDADAFEIDPKDRIHVGLGCIFEDDMEGLVQIIQAWSVAIADSVVEIANHGGWLGALQTPSDETVRALDHQDMIVFDYARENDKALKKDDVLATYANLLAARAQFQAGHMAARNGWQLAIQVLSRLDNQRTSNERIAGLLNSLKLTDPTTVEQAVRLCERLDLIKEAQQLSSGFADHLLETGSQIGDAIVHYARARQGSKLKHTLGILVTYSLVQSSVYPPPESIDATLHALVSSSGSALDALRRHDPEAADMLMFYLSGYATIRKFFEARDAAPSSYERSANRHTAAHNLVSAISSAADGIHGGLVAANVDSVLDVDGLLILLGESLMFLRHQDYTLSLSQIFTILKAIEDLSLAPKEVYQKCDQAFRSAIANAHGTDVPRLQSMMSQRSRSAMSGSSFSLLNSEILDESPMSSGVLVDREISRAWDWRSGFSREAKSQELVAILRLGLAKELGSRWVGMDV